MAALRPERRDSEPPPPGRPDAPSPPELSVAKSGSLSVEWRPTLLGAPAAFYELQYARDELLAAWTSASCEIEDQRFTLRHLDADAKYVFRVRGGNMSGWSAWSATSEPLATLKAGRTPRHAVVLVHSLGLGPDSMAAVADAVQERLGDAAYIISSKWNARPLGTAAAGVDLCGSRLAMEVEEVASTVQSLTTISFVAHGVGALFARYALRDLHEHGVFGALRPAHFISLGAPHAGEDMALDAPLAGPLRKRLAGETGRQVRMEDDADGTGLPLLAHLALDEFTAPLAAFRHRSLYADVAESAVPYESAALLDPSPFAHAEPAQLAAMADPQYPGLLRPDAAGGLADDLPPTPPRSSRVSGGSPILDDEHVGVAGGAEEDAIDADHMPPMLTGEEYRERIVGRLGRLGWERHHVHSKALLPRDDNMVLRKLRWMSRAAATGVAQHVAEQLAGSV